MNQNIINSLLSESSEEIQDILQHKNKYICPPEALTYVCFPLWIVKSYGKSVSNVCIYRLSPTCGWEPQTRPNVNKPS